MASRNAVLGRKRVTPKRALVAFIAGAAVFVLLMTACSGSSSSMAMGGGGSTGPAGPPMHSNRVSITNFAFAPASIKVPAGTTVIWTNGDSVQHDISASGFTSPVLNQSDTYSHTFSQPGTYAYTCSIHPFMHGTVVVTAA